MKRRLILSLIFSAGVLVWLAPGPAQADDCDRERILSECQRERAQIIEVCRSLEDWVVVATIGADADPELTCAAADCSDAIEANETRGDDAFTSVVKSLDKQCDESQPVICQLECYGWSS